MKRLWDVLVLTLALNFLVVAGATGWLYQGGRLDKSNIAKIKEVLFPPPPAQVAQTQPAVSSDPTTQPTLSLEQLLSKHSGMTAGQQVDFVRQTFDERMALLERREHELADLKAQIDMAQSQLTAGREALEADRKKLTDEQELARKLSSDEGFQHSLNIYRTMPAARVKAIFANLSDDAIRQYLMALPERTAAKIIGEFKTPDETDRIKRILESMRKGDPTTQPS
ncbi:MAG TPA: hypothetical protein VN541_08475 [Tepidisphaeraceae bacterium]|nr:hypothetical protein [Tepidisphaeraceae bacterium]